MSNISPIRINTQTAPKGTMKEFNARYSLFSRTMWPGVIRFPHGVTHLPLTAARDTQAAMEILPFALYGLLPGNKREKERGRECKRVKIKNRAGAFDL